jgi:hypothetical protein
VAPKLPMLNFGNNGLADIIFKRKQSLSSISVIAGKGFFYLCDNVFIKLRIVIERSYVRFASPLFYHVSHVVDIVSRKKVIWVAARRVVAFVENFLVFQDFSIYKTPRKAMSLYLDSAKKFTIPVSVETSLVYPAIIFIFNFYMRPKPAIIGTKIMKLIGWVKQRFTILTIILSLQPKRSEAIKCR